MFIQVLWQCSSLMEFCVDVYSGPLAMLQFNGVLCGCLFRSFGNAPVVQPSSVWIGSASVIQLIEFCVDVYSCPLAVLQLYN